MKKYFKTRLLQCDQNQGYISNNKEITDETYWSLFYKTNNALIEDIIVEQTISPFYVQEIVSGVYIPVLYCKKDYRKEQDSRKDKVFFPFGKIHTFVSITHNKTDKTDIVLGLGDEATNEEVEKYIIKHQDVEFWREKIKKYFQEGEEIMQAKIKEEKDRKIQRTLRK